MGERERKVKRAVAQFALRNLRLLAIRNAPKKGAGGGVGAFRTSKRTFTSSEIGASSGGGGPRVARRGGSWPGKVHAGTRRGHSWFFGPGKCPHLFRGDSGPGSGDVSRVLPRFLVHLLDPHFDAQQRRLEAHVVGRDFDHAEERGALRTEALGDELPRRPVADRLAHVAVDVREQPRDLLLRESVEARRLGVGRALGQHLAQQFVVAFHVRLLPRLARVAVEEAGLRAPLLVVLDPGRVGKLRAVVRQDHRKQPHEHLLRLLAVRLAQEPPDPGEYLRDRRRALALQQEGQHEVLRHEVQREQHLPPLPPSTVSISTTGVPGCSARKRW